MPFDGDSSVEIGLSKSSLLDVSISNCNPVSTIYIVSYSSLTPPYTHVHNYTHTSSPPPPLPQFTLTKEVQFSARNEPHQLLPFTEALYASHHDYHFKETCFY